MHYHYIILIKWQKFFNIVFLINTNWNISFNIKSRFLHIINRSFSMFSKIIHHSFIYNKEIWQILFIAFRNISTNKNASYYRRNNRNWRYYWRRNLQKKNPPSFVHHSNTKSFHQSNIIIYQVVPIEFISFILKRDDHLSWSLSKF